jgi:hypothetical protein
MRLYLTILSVLLLLFGFASGCRKTKQNASKPQAAVSSKKHSSIEKLSQSDNNTSTVQQGSQQSPTTEKNKSNEPNLNSDTSSKDSKVEPTRGEPAEPNRPADSNSKTQKAQSEPNVKTNQEQALHPLLTKLNNDYANVLSTHVDSRGMVNYKVLKRKRIELFNLLDELKNFDPNEYKAMSKEDQTAFWINAYNIKMLSIIVDNYPIEPTRLLRMLWPPDSIRHIDQKIGGIEKQKFIVMNEEFTLAELEQEIFYKQFNEPRAFFALTHTSISSPPLRNEPYYGKRLNEQLNDQIKKYLSVKTNFDIDKSNQRVYLPAILQDSWYGRYFTEKYGTDKKFKDQTPEVAAVLNCIIEFLPSDDIVFLELKNYTVDFLNHNWIINEQ